MTERILGYDPLFDIEAYRRLQGLRLQVSVDEYNRLKNQLNTRTRHNLETALGERFKVELSQVIYQIQDGQLVSSEHDQPFLEIIKRGQKYRQENGSNDTLRELAEVEGFTKVQDLLVSGNWPLDAKIIVISPRSQKGSTYQHNFFDIYERKEDILTMTRYTTTAAYHQFRQAADKLDPFNDLADNPQDADFIKTPLTSYKSIEEILALFPPDAGVITRQDLERIIGICSQVILSYVNNPSQIAFSALLNFADRITLTGSDPQTDYSAKPYAITEIVNHFGHLPVRQVAAGCGIQSGFATVSSFSPFSVAEFTKGGCPECGGQTNHFHCPGCNDQI